MEYHEIGERFEFNGVVLEVVRPSDTCTQCYFYESCTHKDIKCTWTTRKDRTNVVFKRVKKPIKRIKIPFEKIKLDVLRKNLKDMEQKTDFIIEGTDKVFATHKTNIQSDEEIYGSLLDKLFTTYKAKDADYGSSFAEMFDELGIDYAYGKLREKMNRIKVLRNKPNMVENEGLEDALLDTAGDAILTLVELKKRKQ